MKKPRRIRRILKWTGLGICVLIIALTSASFWKVLTFTYPNMTELDYLEYLEREYLVRFSLALNSGCIMLFLPDHDVVQDSFATQRDPNIDLLLRFPGKWSNGRYFTLFYVPLWLPFLLFAIPTAFMFWRDRRRIPTGHCQECGYNLTANTSGRCPECGTVI